jgi:urea transport system substrate-binding protein
VCFGVWFGVTAHPTAEWIANQVTEACGWEQAPRYLIRDRDAAYVAAFKKMWGEKTVIGDVTQAAYLGPWLWKLTVEKAGSFDIDKVAAASPGIEFKGAPEGYVRIHENHHLWSKTRVGRAKADGQYELVYETADLVEPNPFPKGYQ